MIIEAIGEASGVEEATQKAKLQLNAPATAEVKIEVIAMPAKKFLGLFGGSNAKVKAYYDDGKTQAKVEPKQAPVQSKPSAPAKMPANKPAPKAKEVRKEQNVPNKEVKKDEPKVTLSPDFDTTVAVNYLAKMLEGLNVNDAKLSANIVDNSVNIEIDCEDYGIIIGRRGETLDALQYLVSLVVNKKIDNYVRVSLNVGNYREKREDTLRNLAKKNASHVLRSGRRVILEPMNPYERRIIHTTIQEIDGVNSRSVGSNGDRKVIIELTDGFKPTGVQKNDRRGGYNRRRPQGDAEVKREPARKLDKSELPKFGKIQ